MNAEEAARGLLAGLATAIGGNAGVASDPDERILDAEGVAIKCLLHGCSCVQLYQGTQVPLPNAVPVDLSSMAVLARATSEAFLTFHYLFCAPTDDAEAELRHQSWVLADLQERQRFHASEPENQRRQENERSQIQSITNRLKANSAFRNLSAGLQREILKRGKWRRQSWTDIGRSAGLGELHADHVYRFLCSYAHTGSLSVLQVRQATDQGTRRQLGRATLRVISVAVAFMTRGYCGKFPRADAALRTDRGLTSLMQDWIDLGSRL